MSRTTAFRLLRGIGVKRTAIAVLIFMFILSTFMMVSPFMVNAAAPSISMSGWKDGQDIIVVSFDDRVHDGAGGPLVASDFTVAGANSISISSVDFGPSATEAIITLSGNLNSGGGTDFTITCASTAVYNGDMEACTSSPVNVYTAIPEDTTGPSVVELVRIGLTDVFAAFDEPVDEHSFGPGSVVLVTSDGGDDSTVTDIMDFGTDAIGVEATGAIIASGSGNTLQITTNVTDIFGNASAGETLTILPGAKISEFRVSSLSSDKDEFIELYNFGPTDVDMVGVKLHFWDGSTDTNVPLTLYNTTIPANGFFLIAPSNFVSGNGVTADASYSAVSAELVANGAVYISYSATADTDVIDLVGWGTSTKKEGTVLADVTDGQNIERLAGGGSDANSMGVSGDDVFNGNGKDSQDNLSDFVVQATAVPQNSFSTPEFAGGAGFNDDGDQDPPTVIDSFPSASTAAFIPQGLDIAGVDFSEQMDPGSIDTTSVWLIVDTDNSTNLCQSVSYDSAATFGAAVTCNVNPSALPLAAVPHTFAVTTDARDFSGNALAADYTVGFTPSGSISFSSQAAPEMVGAFPGPNTSSFPPNGAFININFNQELDSSTLAGNVTLENTTQSTSETITGMQLLSIVDPDDAIELDVSGVSFTAGEDYLVTVTTGVTSSEGVAISETVLVPFTVAGANDSTAPFVVASNPANGDTGVDVGMPIVFISIDDALDASTVDSDSVSLFQGSDRIPSTVTYNAGWREIELSSTVAFDPSTTYTVMLSAATSGNPIQNVSGIDLADTDGQGPADTTHNISFTTGGADVTAPTASFASATQNQIDVTFAEGMLVSSIENLSNWSLESPVSSSVPLSAMAGNDVSWDPSSMTATITGVSLTAGASFEITAGVGIKDMAANPLGSPAVLGGTVLDVATYGSDNGPGAGFTGDNWDLPPAFSGDDFGFVPQAGVWPMNGMAGMTSSYNIDMPISEQIRDNGNGGKLVTTFPTGFDVTNAAADATNPMNRDANGPGVGTFAVNSVTANAAARTVTVDFTGATRCGSGNVDPCLSGDEQDFIGISISGIVNSSVPRDWETAGYTVDIKTMTNGTLLETMTSMPFFINAAGSNSFAVTVNAGSQNAGGVVVHISSPTTGEMTQLADFTGNNGTAVATFTGLPEDYYDIWTEPLVLSDAYQGIMSEQAWVTGSATGSYTLTDTSGFQLVTINVSGTTGEDIDVIASGPEGFQVQRIQNTSGSDQVTMNLPDGEWNFDIGPHMDMGGGFTMPEPPDYLVTPRWLPVRVSNPNVFEDSDTGDDGILEFVLSAAAFTVPVSVVDTSGNPIVDAMVFMDDTTAGFGTFGQTATTGIASLGVNAGTYRVGAFMQGAPPTGEIKVRVAANGDIFQDGSDVSTSTVVLELSKSDTVISGTVTDGSNAIAGAGVHAFCTANCEGYFDAGTMSDANGGYTLYVGNGTWNVEAFIPGYGPTGQTTVAVNDADQTGVNIEPDTNATFRIISGAVCKKDGGAGDCSSGTNLEGLAGIEVFAYSQAAGGGSNFTQTASDGTYSLRVPGATGYTVEAWDHRAGPLPMLNSVDTSGGDATSQDIVISTPLTVAVNIEDGASGAVVLEEIFIELFDDSTGIRQNLFIENDSNGTVDLPPGDYDMFVHTMSAPIDPATDVAGAGGTVVSTGVLTVDSAET
ncbi:MAG TPA: Ig-like domain-containing protein, partial [Patescibacteria group bacterium]|nr:Ig-like domain-containing protein [Patescibacteria group bacterium]